MVVIRGRMKGPSHDESDKNIDRRLVQEYFDVLCKRVVLDAYLDGRKDRKECEEGEEGCEGCQIRVVEEDKESDTMTALSSSSPAPSRVNHSPTSVDPSLRIRTVPLVPIPPIRKSIVVQHQQEVRE